MRTSCGTNEVRYRVRTPLMLLAFGDNHDKALPAAPGLVIGVRSLHDDDRFVMVTIGEEAFHAFSGDIAVCCEPMPARSVRTLALRVAA